MLVLDWGMNVYKMCLKTGGWEFNLRWPGARPRQFFSFLFLPPTCPLFIYLFIYLFFHKDVYKCFPFIIFLNINAPIIIRKPTRFLCSFHK